MLKALSLTVLYTLPCVVSADEVRLIQYYEHPHGTEILTSGNDVLVTTPFAIASIGKTMTSVAVLRLVEKGQLSLDDDVTKWLPDDMFREVTNGLGGLSGLTLRHLLNMTSGLPDYLTDDYLDAAIADPARIQNPRTALTFAYSEAPLFQPGSHFDYSNTNYVLAGLVLEKASGLSYSTVIESEIFNPAGMSQSFVFGTRPLPSNFPNGHEAGQHERSYYEFHGFGDGGIISTAKDLASFFRMLFLERTLLSTGMMDELVHDPLNENYGLGIDVEEGVVGHAGGDLGFSSDVRVKTSTGEIAILLIAKSDADTSWTDTVLNRSPN